MPRGGKRAGAGRKPGTPNRPKSEIRKARALAQMARVAREQARAGREAENAARAEAREDRAEHREAKAERIRAEILPPLPSLDMPSDVSPLEFLQSLMRHPELPLGFRRDCAALALPYAHAKPIMGLKDARRALAFDDDGDDELAAAMRA